MKKLFLLLLLFLPGCHSGDLTYDEALEKLDSLLDRVSVRENYTTRGDELVKREKNDLMTDLPDIEQYPVTLEPSAGGVIVEIFSSTEKAGKNKPDNWLTIMGEKFNSRNMRTSSGARGQVRLRSIASGVAYQFIASGKALPEGFTPSNHLWIKMVEAYGVRTKVISESLADNPAGIVMKKSTYKAFEEKWGTVDVKNLITAVAQGELAMGYTNPFASSTGLNFLITVLAVFADNREEKMLTPEVISAFEAFQQGVPFVSLTTLQMRESVENQGSLDTFVMEYQTFINIPQLKNYEFIPFGISHANPLYATGNVEGEKLEVLEAFAQFLKSPSARSQAEQYGFNPGNKTASQYSLPSGDTLINAQQLWKEKKDAGRPVIALFLADVSGSMLGVPLNSLRKGLIQGLNYISPDNYIGLVSFSSEVDKMVRIKKFTPIQQSILNSAVKQLSPEGGTAMYDGVAVSLKLLAEAKKEVPNGKPLLIVLTDGENSEGLEFKDIQAVVRGLKIPVYTIGYNANIAALKELSAINEAATVNAYNENISYVLGSLLNAEL